MGLSELAGTLECLKMNIDDGVASKILHASVSKDMNDLWVEHDMGTVVQVLNTQNYPHLDRSEVSILSACKNLLKFAGAVHGKYERFMELFFRSTTNHVGTAWLLQLAALTEGSVWSKGVENVPKLPVKEKEELAANPGKAKLLANFLAAAVGDLAGTRSKKRVRESTAKLSWSDSEEEDEAKEKCIVLSAQQNKKVKKLAEMSIDVNQRNADKVMAEACVLKDAIAGLTDNIDKLSEDDVVAVRAAVANFKKLRKAVNAIKA